MFLRNVPRHRCPARERMRCALSASPICGNLIPRAPEQTIAVALPAERAARVHDGESVSSSNRPETWQEVPIRRSSARSLRSPHIGEATKPHHAVSKAPVRNWRNLADPGYEAKIGSSCGTFAPHRRLPANPRFGHARGRRLAGRWAGRPAGGKRDRRPGDERDRRPADNRGRVRRRGAQPSRTGASRGSHVQRTAPVDHGRTTRAAGCGRAPESPVRPWAGCRASRRRCPRRRSRCP